MRTVIVRIGATGAGALLALGLLAGPSAAKGSDKQSEEKVRESNKVTCFQPDEGKTQGRSLSDPDGDTNGGADKPGCTRESPWDADTDNDGNNGCGNDADREDDNNGNCGGENTQGPENEPGDEQDDGDDVTDNTETGGDVTVQGTGLESEAEVANTTTADTAAVTAADGTTPAAQATTPEPETKVLGVTLTAPDTLPRTGAGIGGLALLGGLLVGGGRLTVLARKLLRIG